MFTFVYSALYVSFLLTEYSENKTVSLYDRVRYTRYLPTVFVISANFVDKLCERLQKVFKFVYCIEHRFTLRFLKKKQKKTLFK